VPPTQFMWAEDQKLIDSCVPAGRNIIRVMDEPWWAMCTNIEWQACLMQGMLPGQVANEAQFARAPKWLNLAEFWSPLDPCRTGDCNLGFATSDVYFWEVCYFNHACSNREELFRMDVGQTFTCEFDVNAYRELQSILA